MLRRAKLPFLLLAFLGTIGLLQFRSSGFHLPSRAANVTGSTMGELPQERNENMELATFGAGCFWGVEATFRRLPGVTATMVGYTGGELAQPTYQQVCTDRTGHAEAVQIEFDPQQISYEKLLDVFFANHDPTQLNRQGPDFGSQYRSAVFYHNDAQRQSAESTIARFEQSSRIGRPIVTQVIPASPFWKAEDYHQQYLEKRGLDNCHVR